jgi:hypothetical protein
MVSLGGLKAQCAWSSERGIIGRELSEGERQGGRQGERGDGWKSCQSVSVDRVAANWGAREA